MAWSPEWIATASDDSTAKVTPSPSRAPFRDSISLSVDAPQLSFHRHLRPRGASLLCPPARPPPAGHCADVNLCVPAQVWSAKRQEGGNSWELAATLQHESPVWCCCFAIDGRTLVTGTKVSSMTAWKVLPEGDFKKVEEDFKKTVERKVAHPLRLPPRTPTPRA